GFRWGARLGVGVLLGSFRDQRSGTFTNNITPTRYNVGPISESPGLLFGYVAPQLSIGHTLGERFELSVNAEVLTLVALSQPTGKHKSVVVGGKEGKAPSGTQALAGKAILVPAPGLSLRFQLGRRRRASDPRGFCGAPAEQGQRGQRPEPPRRARGPVGQ